MGMSSSGSTERAGAGSPWAFSDSVGVGSVGVGLPVSAASGASAADLAVTVDRLQSRLLAMQCQHDLEVADLKATIALLTRQLADARLELASRPR